MTAQPQSLYSNWLLTIAFLAMIALPLVVGLIEPDKEISESEKRTLKQWPSWSEAEHIESYFDQITDYAADQMGLRDTLIGVEKRLRWWLGQSPSKNVVRGADDWLYLLIRDPLLSKQAVDNTLVMARIRKRAEYVKRTYQEMADMGITYQYLVTANKMTLYPEYLPAKFRFTDVTASYKVFKSHFTADDPALPVYADEVLEGLKTQWEFPFYFKNDSHWNFLGAHLVTNESLKRIQAQRADLPLTLNPEREFKGRLQIEGDLSQYIGLGGQLTEMMPVTPLQTCASRHGVTRYKYPVNQTQCAHNDVSMILVGDSFMQYNFSFYAESVGRVYMISQDVPKGQLMSWIRHIKPDIVVEEVVERHLAAPLKY